MCRWMNKSCLLLNLTEEAGPRPRCSVVSRIPQNRVEGLQASIQGQGNHAWLSQFPSPVLRTSSASGAVSHWDPSMPQSPNLHRPLH